MKQSDIWLKWKWITNICPTLVWLGDGIHIAYSHKLVHQIKILGEKQLNHHQIYLLETTLSIRMK